jgi:hypothetical protein
MQYIIYQRIWGLKAGRKGPTDLDFFHFDPVSAVRYNCHVFSIATASLQCTVLVVEHKWKQMHVLDATALPSTCLCILRLVASRPATIYCQQYVVNPVYSIYTVYIILY